MESTIEIAFDAIVLILSGSALLITAMRMKRNGFRKTLFG